MKAVHLLRVEAPPQSFAGLIEAASEAGLRVGWLDLETSVPAPAELDEAARSGALRAVSSADGRVVAVKRLRGAAVLRDLLREHFRGCSLVLVRGEIDRPLLIASGTDWILRDESGERRLGLSDLLQALRRPPAEAARPIRRGG